MSVQRQIIEHIVLFNVKPDVDATKVKAMVDGINGLISLDLAIHVSGGELLRFTSTSSSLTFSHILHCRFKSNDDLNTYSVHPEHMRVVTEIIQPVIDDILVVDWISDCVTDSPKPGSAMRVRLLKLKENLIEIEKTKVIEGIKNGFKSVERLSVGENFSHAMAKGYSIASTAFFPRSLELDSEVNSLKEDSVESEIVVDYVIPLSN